MPAAPLPPLPRSPSGLVLTGERTLPGVPEETYWFQRHVVAYRLAAARVRGEVVLDAGCGEGYGLEMLAEAGARRVIGVDLEPQVVAHVEATYAARSPVIEAQAAELMSLPLADDEVDVTVSFQVIEHLHDIPGYLASLRRVTRPQGDILIATPNRLTFTPGSDTPVNPFHTREFTAAELTHELERAGLRVASVLGIHHGRRLRAIEAATRQPFTDHLTASAPHGWPAWLRTLVPRIGADWFEVRTDDLDASLDLLAVCRVPRA
ncbi:MAG: class I SAM-dependent methyltransferase [Actinobacteria bacterium]|nr:class I SAM-dependent methyltransferase [Actinomycetota bacterium]